MNQYMCAPNQIIPQGYMMPYPPMMIHQEPEVPKFSGDIIEWTEFRVLQYWLVVHFGFKMVPEFFFTC